MSQQHCEGKEPRNQPTNLEIRSVVAFHSDSRDEDEGCTSIRKLGVDRRAGSGLSDDDTLGGIIREEPVDGDGSVLLLSSHHEARERVSDVRGRRRTGAETVRHDARVRGGGLVPEHREVVENAEFGRCSRRANDCQAGGKSMQSYPLTGGVTYARRLGCSGEAAQN